MSENTTPTKLECLVDTSLLNNPQRFKLECLVDTSLLNNPQRLRERAEAIEANEAGRPVDKWDDVNQKWIELVEISAFFYDSRYRARPTPVIASASQCGEVLEWDDEGEQPILRCKNAADWINLKPCEDSIRAICDKCAAIRFPSGLSTSDHWHRIDK